ncbi:MAG: hypothetical protein ACK5UG_12295 [Synechococcaceae cyanobacterium]
MKLLLPPVDPDGPAPDPWVDPYQVVTTAELSDAQGRRWLAEHWQDTSGPDPASGWWNVWLPDSPPPLDAFFASVEIRDWEGFFARDLDGDGQITPRRPAVVVDDGSQPDRVGLGRSGEGVLTLTTPLGDLPLYGLGLQQPLLPGADGSEVRAAAGSPAAGYWLARRDRWSDGADGASPQVQWSIQRVGADGAIDWGTAAYDVDLTRWERFFAEDLNGDGTIAPVPPAQVIDGGDQPDGVGLRLSGEGVLQITTPAGVRELTGLDSFWSLNRTQSRQGLAPAGRAAAADGNGGFWLACRDDQGGSEPAASWTVFAIDRQGAADGASSFYGLEDITIWESTFAQDLDGDGLIAPAPERPPAELLASRRGYFTAVGADGVLRGQDGPLSVRRPDGPRPPLSPEPGQLIVGTPRSERLSGGTGNDRIIGGRVGASRFGIDRIRSGTGIDRIVLGVDDQDFYTLSGRDDFALIRQFAPGRDRLLLAGEASSYRLQANLTLDRYSGTGLFAADGDLIALVQVRGSAPLDLAQAMA